MSQQIGKLKHRPINPVDIEGKVTTARNHNVADTKY